MRTRATQFPFLICLWFVFSFLFTEFSKTAQENTETKDGMTTVTFEKTPIMSSYLVAFLVGDFASVEGVYGVSILTKEICRTHSF